MSKIHHKIYATQPNPKDDILYKKIQSFSWIEPGNIKKNLDNYNFELVLPEITRAFNYINIEKSPKKKIENMQNIFGYISQLLSFSQDGSAIGVDDQMPLLNYVFIKAKPKGIYTDMEFMELYMGDKKKKKEGNNLVQLGIIRDMLFGLSETKLINVSKEEFEENCKKALES
jgi:hypothetical protein